MGIGRLPVGKSFVAEFAIGGFVFSGEQDGFLGGEAVFEGVEEVAALPSSVTGPVLCWALAVLAAIWAAVAMLESLN